LWRRRSRAGAGAAQLVDRILKLGNAALEELDSPAEVRLRGRRT